jgi:hypothetical protein
MGLPPPRRIDMHRRYKPSVPPAERVRRPVEAWLVLAIALVIAVVLAGSVVRHIIAPAFAETVQTGEAR